MRTATSHPRSAVQYRMLLGMVLGLLLLAGVPASVSAQKPVPLPPPGPPGVPLPIEPIPPFPPVVPPPAVPNQVTVELNKVEAVVDGPIATISVEQVFRNDGGQTAEGVYVFPLPTDGAVSDFQMTVNGQTLEGKLLDKEDARRLYEQIVRQRRDPALLEYLDRGLFQANVFPIPPGESRTLGFTYTQILEQKDGLYHFNFPLRTRQYSSLPPEQVSVSVELRNQAGLRTIYSPELPIRVDRTEDDSALVTFEQAGEQPPADFDLYFGTDESAVGLNLLSYKPAGEDGYFALLAAPSLKVPGDEVVARDVVLVVDISGSMKGEKMDQARAAARYVVDALNPQDRFDIIAFSSAADAWSGKLRDPNAQNREAAQEWIDHLRASGSTDINRALLEALAELDAGRSQEKARPAYVLFLTDGQPTVGETDAERIVANVENNTPAGHSVRLFPFGIGYDVNTDLLDTLGSLLGGRSSYVQPDARIDEAVGSFYAQISTPVLANVALDFGGSPGAKEIFPYPLPDLFAGEQLVAVGRYEQGGTVNVELKGDVNGEERLYVYGGRELVSSGGEPFVAKLWATRRIGELLSQVRRTGAEQELIDEIVDLSLRYGIVTPYTSYLVLEPGDYVPQPLEANGGSGAANGTGPLAAPRDVTLDAAKGVAVAAAEAAAAPPSGEAAVQASVARTSLESATTVTQDAAVRYAGGRTFQRQVNAVDAEGRPVELWVDTSYREGMAVTEVPFGSDAYFALLDRSGMAEWLAVALQVVIVTGDNTAVRITAEQ